MIKTEDLRIRDPYIVLHNDTYYLYRSYDLAIWVLRSKDMKTWDEPIKVYTIPENSWGYADLWAPEVHLYNGKFYMFLSLLGKNGLRGTEISVSNTPDGFFTPISNRPATPLDKSCIDGSLIIDGGKPYMVYSHDWPDNYVKDRDVYVGEIWAVELSEDLTTPVGEPFFLFASDECPYSALAAAPTEWEDGIIMRYGSDAPFVQRLNSGKLFLTWSPIPNNNYVVIGAVADSIKGPWKHCEKPVFDKNGGHAMFFTDKDGTLKMCIHCPEKEPFERALILSVCEEKGEIVLK